MKQFLKKIKDNWVDYLVIFISVLAVCFVYLFTAFYQPKENKNNINKENIVKVLRDKKNAQESNFKSEQTAFYIGNMSRYNSNNTFIEFYLNFDSIDIYYYEQTYDNIEIELGFYITASTKYFDNVGMQTNATFNPTSIDYKNFVMTNQTIKSVHDIENIELRFNMINLRYEGGYEEEDVYFDFEIQYDLEITLNNIKDVDHNAIFSDNYNSFGIDASNLPVSVREQINNNIFVDIEDVTANTSIRDFKIYFNTVDAGYNNGYHEGFEDGYYNGYNTAYDYALDLGYQNGYNDGVIAGSNDFNILNFIRSLFDIIWGFLNVEMLPNIKLVYIVSIPLILSVIKFILGWFR